MCTVYDRKDTKDLNEITLKKNFDKICTISIGKAVEKRKQDAYADGGPDAYQAGQ
jgi:hypothetical protein